MQVYNDELHHYGVKGMKWGHHRIKAGTIVQRITDNKDEKKDGRTYVSFKYLDNLKYVHAAGQELYVKYSAEAPNGYKVELKVTNDIIYPSYKKSMETFVKTISNNSIDKIAEGMDKKNFETFMRGVENKTVDELIDKSYKSFSKSLMKSEHNRKIFFSELQKQGYNAVVDHNDVGWTDAPLIVFEKSNNLKQISATPISFYDQDVAFMKMKKKYDGAKKVGEQKY